MHRRMILQGITFGLMSSILGCSASGGARPAEPDRAKNAVKAGLEAWKKGEKPESMANQSPSVTFVDEDWSAGQTLVAFEIVDPLTPAGNNLSCTVTLTVQPPGGRAVKKRVQYTVGTHPSITVVRSDV